MTPAAAKIPAWIGLREFPHPVVKDQVQPCRRALLGVR